MMSKASRAIGAMMIFGGAVVTAGDVLADTARATNNYFSGAQIMLALAGQVVVIIGAILLLVSTDQS
jgi:hypothetical protein